MPGLPAPSPSPPSAGSARSRRRSTPASNAAARAIPGPFEPILVAAAAQILFLDVPDHAAVDLAIRHLHEDPRSARYVALGNALLRRLARERDAILAETAADAFRDTPDWLAESWREGLWRGDGRRHRRDPSRGAAARPHASRPIPPSWAERLDGIVLPTGSVRLRERQHRHRPARLRGRRLVGAGRRRRPARELLAPKPGERVVDLCAAPGGKTAQIAAAGASRHRASTARPPRLRRLEANLARLGLPPRSWSTGDAATWQAEPFDAVLLDAPCSATGTIRRHPDVAWTQDGPRIATGSPPCRSGCSMPPARLTKPGGRLVYCTCSLEPQEGEAQIAAFLERNPRFRREPAQAAEIGGLAEAIDAIWRYPRVAAPAPQPFRAVIRMDGILRKPSDQVMTAP